MIHAELLRAPAYWQPTGWGGPGTIGPVRRWPSGRVRLHERTACLREVRGGWEQRRLCDGSRSSSSKFECCTLLPRILSPVSSPGFNQSSPQSRAETHAHQGIKGLHESELLSPVWPGPMHLRDQWENADVHRRPPPTHKIAHADGPPRHRDAGNACWKLPSLPPRPSSPPEHHCLLAWISSQPNSRTSSSRITATPLRMFWNPPAKPPP